MCVICASAAGVRQPSDDELHRMFNSNPHGAGYMFARDGVVTISKGFMSWADFRHAIHYEKFTEADAVVYHCRISTQAGVGPEMTHPFPITKNIAATRMLDLTCPIGVAHNGIVELTTDHRDKIYNDTAHFAAEFLPYLIRSADDLHDEAILDAVYRIARSKFAFLDSTGYIATVGDFIEDGGLLFSNTSYKSAGYQKPINYKRYRNFSFDEFAAEFDDETKFTV